MAVLVCMVVVPSIVLADTIVSGDLKIRDGGDLVFSDGSVQSKAQLVGPKGDKGDGGPPNTLTIGNVTTGNPGTAASATITGTAPNQVLNLLIPQGPQGVPALPGGVAKVAFAEVNFTTDTPNIVTNFSNISSVNLETAWEMKQFTLTFQPGLFDFNPICITDYSNAYTSYQGQIDISVGMCRMTHKDNISIKILCGYDKNYAYTNPVFTVLCFR